MIVKWNNNIVDYKFKVFFFSKRYKSILFFYVGLCLEKNKKNKKENMQHMTSGTINRSHQPCVDVTPPGPHHHTERVSTRVSGTGGGRSNKERQRLQPQLVSVEVRFTHRLYWHTHLLHWHPTVGINAPPEWRTFFFCCFLWFSLSSLRFLPPGVGLTGSSRPSKVFEDWAQTNASKRRHVGLHRTNSDWSRGYIAFRLKTGSALIAVWKGTASCSTF